MINDWCTTPSLHTHLLVGVIIWTLTMAYVCNLAFLWHHYLILPVSLFMGPISDFGSGESELHDIVWQDGSLGQAGCDGPLIQESVTNHTSLASSSIHTSLSTPDFSELNFRCWSDMSFSCLLFSSLLMCEKFCSV